MNADEALLLYVDEYSRMAEEYDRRVRPRFEPVARRLVEILDPQPGEAVLEVGAGTGTATLMISPPVGPQGLVVATDLSDGQLAVIQRRASEAGASNIRAEMMDGTVLTYPRHAFTAVTSSFGIPMLRWPQTFAEAYRVLQDGGRFVFSRWLSMEWLEALTEAQKPHLTADPSPQLATLREGVQVLRDHRKSTEPSDPDLYARFTQEALEKAGFRGVRIDRETFHPGFAAVDDFLDFRLAWGYEEREWREMGGAARIAFRKDLDRVFRERFGGVEALEFRVFFASGWKG